MKERTVFWGKYMKEITLRNEHIESTSQLHWADPPGTLQKACNAGLLDMEWVIEDLTKSEIQQSWCIVVLRIRKVPL